MQSIAKNVENIAEQIQYKKTQVSHYASAQKYTTAKTVLHFHFIFAVV